MEGDADTPATADDTPTPEQLAKAQQVPVASGHVLAPEYMIFHKIAGFPLWPAWIIPPWMYGEFKNEEVFKNPSYRVKIANNGEACASVL